MSEELESGTQSDVSPESTVSSETASSAQSQETVPQQEAQATPAQEQQVPFDKHPRFQELIREKNEYAKQLRSMQEQFSRFEQQYKQQPQPKAPDYTSLLAEMEQVNPAFAGYMKELQAKASKVEQLESSVKEVSEWRTSYEQERARTQFDRLCEENKVSDADKGFYKHWVANMANARNARLSDLPALFKEAHDEISTSLQARDRAIREGYVKQKKSDVGPATQTGGTPAGLPAKSGPMTKDDVKAAFAKAWREGSRI